MAAPDQDHEINPGDGGKRLRLKRPPERKYYAISDVAKETELRPYVLRFWEKEFPMLRPRKSRTNNNRQYQRRDIDLIKRIKHLLYTEGYTIDGARQRLRGEISGGEKAGEKAVAQAVGKTIETSRVREMLTEIRRELEALVAILE
jgi:DNA-binding transcriptional MerR regulator